MIQANEHLRLAFVIADWIGTTPLDITKILTVARGERNAFGSKSPDKLRAGLRRIFAPPGCNFSGN